LPVYLPTFPSKRVFSNSLSSRTTIASLAVRHVGLSPTFPGIQEFFSIGLIGVAVTFSGSPGSDVEKRRLMFNSLFGQSRDPPASDV
jgi:hypothetical protein